MISVLTSSLVPRLFVRFPISVPNVLLTQIWKLFRSDWNFKFLHEFHFFPNIYDHDCRSHARLKFTHTLCCACRIYIMSRRNHQQSWGIIPSQYESRNDPLYIPQLFKSLSKNLKLIRQLTAWHLIMTFWFILRAHPLITNSLQYLSLRFIEHLFFSISYCCYG